MPGLSILQPMSFVDAYYNRKRDRIYVAERINGQRVLSDHPVEHVLYYSHPAGAHRSIFGDSCKRFSTTDQRKFNRELSRLNEKGVRLFESDIRPEFRFLADKFGGVDAPKLNVGFFDIEVDFSPERGFAPTEDPFNAITAISIHISSMDRLFTLVLCPPTLTCEQGHEIANKFEDTLLFDDEVELLQAFLELIDDVDVLSGWNSEGFDIPYVVNRISQLISQDETRKLCLWGQSPRPRTYLKYGKEFATYDLVGRVHLDYLLLYQKHNTQQLHSYRLDYVGEIEVKENKIPYEGTLDDLYKKDFYRFIEYNRQDTLLLVKIDRKRKFIELANQIAHANGVLLKTTMGSVALVEQAIINAMHDMGFVVPNRRPKEEDAREVLDLPLGMVDDDDEDEDDGRTPVVGAYVAKPKTGIHSEVGCADINSLYPSAIRALNMSPETIRGQVRLTATMELIHKRIASGVKRAEAWDGLFNTLEVQAMFDRSEDVITIDFVDGETLIMTGAELYEYVFNPDNQVCITANGTIVATDRDGIIPQLLASWYSERKSMQALEADFAKIADGIEITPELAEMLT